VELLGANPVDVVVLIIILVSALLALLRGFVAEILSFIGFVVATAVTVHYRLAMQPMVENYVGQDSIVSVAATIALLFFGTLAVASAVSYIISRQIRATRLSAADRSLGFLLGLVRGWLLVCLLFIPIDLVFKPNAGEQPEPGTLYATLVEARTYPMLASGAGWLMSFAPKEGLSIEDLTKKTSLFDMIQPTVAPATSPVTPPPATAAYGQTDRQDLERVLNTMDGDTAPAPKAAP